MLSRPAKLFSPRCPRSVQVLRRKGVLSSTLLTGIRISPFLLRIMAKPPIFKDTYLGVRRVHPA
eukprot:3199863-Karenia_brevis.AAC.1